MQSDYSNILWVGTAAFGTVTGEGKVLNRRERRELPQRTQRLRDCGKTSIGTESWENRHLTSQRALGQGGAPIDDLVLRRCSDFLVQLRKLLCFFWGIPKSGGFVGAGEAFDLRAHGGILNPGQKFFWSLHGSFCPAVAIQPAQHPLIPEGGRLAGIFFRMCGKPSFPHPSQQR